MDIREKLKLLLGLKKLPEFSTDKRPLQGFTDEQLEEADQKSKAVFTAAKEDKDIDTAEEAFAISQAIKEEVELRTQERKDLDERFAALEEQLDPEAVVVETDPADAVDPPADPDPVDPPADPAVGTDPPADPAVETPPPAVAADATPDTEGADALRAKLLAAAAKPIVPRSSGLPSEATPVRIVASAGGAEVAPGMTMTMEEMGKAFVAKADAISGSKSKSKDRVAKIHLNDLPDDVTFDRRAPAEESHARIMELVSAAQEETSARLRQIVGAGRDGEQVLELTAAGGFCRPFPVRYDICTQGDDDRPLRDSLISLNLPRGGTQFITPPTLSVVDGSVNVYTEAQDTTGYDYPKGCIRVECPESDEAVVQAITLCMEVGNFQRLAWPEVFQTWWTYGKIQHARTAEVELWDRMVSLSTARTANGASGTGFGAFRNTITELERYSKQLRYEYRIAPAAPLRLWIPDWAIAQLRADLTNQQPGDSTLGVSDAALYQYLASLNIAVSTVMDGQDPGNGDDPLPTSVVGILALEGTFIFGEMGELDFGTEIRDWTQIRQNDSGAFMETFETVFAVCNGPQAITLPICPSGTSSAAVEDVVVCAS